ncbi:PucR family transcriptional regulator [Paramicrobacterium chengjingii]|uniref:PucR family transcriptional regulator n=1 Tax=Paramicrobacterium chengjingii TaxID=2769067 RepID=A0ABX6YKI6_9MICO|nr:PucR family transcriptional regulator [Microbacterium chengjingii]QPZ38852.1 PucR family transcriptional regulator [Microbacterium chengjingii]
MAITVRRLLARDDLGLRLLSRLPETASPTVHPLDQSITWVAGTDLDDPTPFLAEGNVVLTTGRQFDHTANDTVDDYVTRLATFGIRAIGFATGVISNVPAELVTACQREQMPLFDVPYRTPFIAVTRYVADLVTAEAQGRSAWAADAQRSISLAALRNDGLHSSIVELSRLLDRPVTLFDARGDALHAVPAPLEVQSDTRRLLDRGIPTAIETDNGVLLQTIGRGGQLRGVLAVAGPLDNAAQSVVASVVALAVMALEQRRSLAEASLALRTGAWSSLRAGDVALARQLAGGSLPKDPVVVGLLSSPAPHEQEPRSQVAPRVVPHSSALDSVLSDPKLGTVFIARDGLCLAALFPAAETPGPTASDESLADAIAKRHGIRVGLSSFTTLDDIPRAVTEAERALGRTRAEGVVARFDQVTDAGFDAVLDTDAARSLARAMLRPVADHDAAHGTALVTALGVWLEHNGALHPAAASLGIHRHTLRKHIQKVEQLLSRNLTSAKVRAELTLALDALAQARSATRNPLGQEPH